MGNYLLGDASITHKIMFGRTCPDECCNKPEPRKTNCCRLINTQYHNRHTYINATSRGFVMHAHTHTHNEIHLTRPVKGNYHESSVS